MNDKPDDRPGAGPEQRPERSTPTGGEMPAPQGIDWKIERLEPDDPDEIRARVGLGKAVGRKPRVSLYGSGSDNPNGGRRARMNVSPDQR